MPVGRIRFLTYTLSGPLGGLNGALLAGCFRGANVDTGNEYLLAPIAVVVIGGTSVAGGAPRHGGFSPAVAHGPTTASPAAAPCRAPTPRCSARRRRFMTQ